MLGPRLAALVHVYGTVVVAVRIRTLILVVLLRSPLRGPIRRAGIHSSPLTPHVDGEASISSTCGITESGDIRGEAPGFCCIHGSI
jgi:hypothetical protein